MLKLLSEGADERPANDSIYPIMVPPTPLSENIDNIDEEEVERFQFGKTDKDQLYDQRKNYEAEVSVYRAVERLKDIKGIVLHSLEYTVSNLKLFTDYSVNKKTGKYVKSGKGGDTEGECDILFMGDNYFVIIEVKANPDGIYGGRIQCLRRELLIEAIFRKMQSSESLGRIREPKIRPKIIKCVAIPLCVECEKSDEVTSVTNEDGECKPNPIHTCTSEDNPQQKKVYVLCEEGTPGSEVHTCPRNNKEYTVYKEKNEVKGKDVCTGLADYISGTHLKDDNTFREWWKKNVEPHTQQNSTDPADAFAAELYKKTGDVLIALWRQTMEKKEKTSRRQGQGSVASLCWNVMKINERLKNGRITYVKNEAVDPSNPNVVKAPEEIKTYIGVKYLTKKQNEIFKFITESTDQCLWVNGPAGSGKTVLLAGRVIQFAKLHPDKKILVVKSTRPSDPQSPSLYRSKCDGAGIKYFGPLNYKNLQFLEEFNDKPVTIVEHQIDSDVDFQEFQNVVKSNAERYGLVVIDDRTGVNNQIDMMGDYFEELQSTFADTQFRMATDIETAEIRAEEVKDFATSNPDKKILVLEIMRHSGPPPLYQTACKKAGVIVEVLTKKEYETDNDKLKQLKDIQKLKRCTVMILEQQVGSHKHMDYLDSFAFPWGNETNYDLVVIDDCNGDKNVNIHIGQMIKFFKKMHSSSTSYLMAADIEQRSSKGVGTPQIGLDSKSFPQENPYVSGRSYSIVRKEDGAITTAKIIMEETGDKREPDVGFWSSLGLIWSEFGLVWSEFGLVWSCFIEFCRLWSRFIGFFRVSLGFDARKRELPLKILYLTENLRNTIDISSVLSVIRDMSDKETVFEEITETDREVFLPKQVRGHFIRGTLPLIHVFNEYKAKKDEIEKVLEGELRKLNEFNKKEVAVIYDDIEVKHFNSEGKWIKKKELREALPIPVDVKNVTVCTVDKCDSSEWPAVIVLLRAMKKSDKEKKPEVSMLNKLYKAVSRARVHCVVIFFPHEEETLSDETYEMCDLLEGLKNLALIIRH